jgi:DnaK suppressor protein
MDKAQTATLRATLEARREEILRSLRGIQLESRSLNRDCPQDSAEQSTTDYSREFLFEYSNAQRRRLQMVEAALRRIEDGAFGICLVCGEAINPKRLRAVPWTQLCVSCQERLERGELLQLRTA